MAVTVRGHGQVVAVKNPSQDVVISSQTENRTAIAIQSHGRAVTVRNPSQYATISSSEEFKMGVVSGVVAPPLPYYAGEYEVVPAPDEQVLETALHTMRDDVTVHPIPYHSVSNDAGGYTVSIAS